MAGLLRRLKNKGKDSTTTQEPPPEKNFEHKTILELSTDQSSGNSPDSDLSPEHPPIAVSGSLFSGLTLTKVARKQEHDSSPYLQKRRLDPTGQDENCQVEEPTFSFLNPNSSSEDTGQVDTSQLGFSFIKVTQIMPTEGDDLTDVDKQQFGHSSFSFLTENANEKEDISSGLEVLTSPPDEKELPPSDITKLSKESKDYSESGTNVVSTLSSSASETSRHFQPIQKVSRQAPPSAKKKKHRALRPGQERHDEVYSSLINTNDVPVQETCNTPSQNPDIIGVEVLTSIDVDNIINPSTESLSEITPVENTIPKTIVSTMDNETQISLPENEAVNFAEELHDKESVDSIKSVEGTIDNQEENETALTSQEFEEPTISEDLTELFTETPSNQATSTSNYDVELLPSEKLIALKEVFENNNEKIRLESDDLEKQYGSVMEESLTALRQCIMRKQHMKELKVKEESALAEENYELAEELSKELEAVDVTEELTLVDKAHLAITEWITHCQNLLSSELTLQHEVQQQLIQLKDEQLKEVSSLEKEFLSRNAKDKMKLHTMKDKIEKEQRHIALDREHLEKKEQLLQEEVSQRAAEFIACKKQLQEDEERVQKDIEDLQAKLQQLQERHMELTSLIAEENDKINAVHKELSSVHEQLDQERATITLKEEELHQQVNLFNEFEHTYSSSTEDHNATKESIQSIINDSDESISKIITRSKELEQARSQSEKWHLKLITVLLKPSEQLKGLLDKEKSVDNEVKEITAKVLSMQSELSALRKKISDMESQLPQLQEAKKTAVTARQYRDAARISNEEKELLNKLETQKEELSNIEDLLLTENVTLTGLNDQLSNIHDERVIMEKEEDIGHINELVKSLVLQRSRQSSIGNDSLYSVLEQWCTFHQLLIENLCAKHDLNTNDFLTEEVLQAVKHNNEHLSTSEVCVTEVEDKTQVQKASWSEERTPGVGMEEPEQKDIEENSLTKEIRAKVIELEMKITKACQDENFELAAELDEELISLKTQLPEVSSA